MSCCDMPLPLQCIPFPGYMQHACDPQVHLKPLEHSLPKKHGHRKPKQQPEHSPKRQPKGQPKEQPQRQQQGRRRKPSRKRLEVSSEEGQNSEKQSVMTQKSVLEHHEEITYQPREKLEAYPLFNPPLLFFPKVCLDHLPALFTYPPPPFKRGGML